MASTIGTLIEFEKPYKRPTDLVALLKSRGLAIDDDKLAEDYLKSIGYYRLSGYLYSFLKTPKEDHVFKNDTNFRNVINLYRFDKKLRILLINEIEKIEIAVRSAIANIGCQYYGSQFWITDSNNFTYPNVFNNTIGKINEAVNTSKESFAEHFKQKYSNAYPPAWMISELLTFGSVTKIYSNIKNAGLKKQIANHFGMPRDLFKSWLEKVSLTRNTCCHHARIWNRANQIAPALPNNLDDYPWIANIVYSRRRYIYFDICIIKCFIDIISPDNDMADKLYSLLDEFPQVRPEAMGFPSRWKDESIWQ